MQYVYVYVYKNTIAHSQIVGEWVPFSQGKMTQANIQAESHVGLRECVCVCLCAVE